MKKWESPIVEELDITMTASGTKGNHTEKEMFGTGGEDKWLKDIVTPSSN